MYKTKCMQNIIKKIMKLYHRKNQIAETIHEPLAAENRMLSY